MEPNITKALMTKFLMMKTMRKMKTMKMTNSWRIVTHQIIIQIKKRELVEGKADTRDDKVLED